MNAVGVFLPDFLVSWLPLDPERNSLLGFLVLSLPWMLPCKIGTFHCFPWVSLDISAFRFCPFPFYSRKRVESSPVTFSLFPSYYSAGCFVLKLFGPDFSLAEVAPVAADFLSAIDSCRRDKVTKKVWIQEFNIPVLQFLPLTSLLLATPVCKLKDPLNNRRIYIGMAFIWFIARRKSLWRRYFHANLPLQLLYFKE